MGGVQDDAKPNRVQVVVRVRPVLPHEKAQDVAVSVSGTRVQVILPEWKSGRSGLPGMSTAGARQYEFDACLGGNTSQDEVFDVCGMSDLVDSALEGYHVTLFAFGQTGSGKTHTVIGPRISQLRETQEASNLLDLDPEDGILTRCLAYAFQQMSNQGAHTLCTCYASCVEIYNEAVTDLLSHDKTKNLAVRKDSTEGFIVSNLTQVQCQNQFTAVKAMHKGLQFRHMRSHKLNEYSSRSHCLMQFSFETQDGDGPTRRGKLTLVDLAGSERLKQTGNTEHAAIRETGAINKSLFTLGQVLACLSTTKAQGAPVFVPYRDSKLTQLLWNGLKGTGRTLMLACLGPLKVHVEESLNTLHFASMALRIKSKPVIILDPQDQLVQDLRKIIQQLRQENQNLASALQHVTAGGDLTSIVHTLPTTLQLQGPGLMPGAVMQPPGSGAGGQSAASSDGRIATIEEDSQEGPSERSTPLLPEVAPGRNISGRTSAVGRGAGGRGSSQARRTSSSQSPGGAGPGSAYDGANASSSGASDWYRRVEKPSPTASPARPHNSDITNKIDRIQAQQNQNTAAAAPARGPTSPPPSQQPAPQTPDTRALAWARKNRWFGSDVEMTAFAYDVHDQLVGQMQMDPSSDVYYAEIERQVAEQFPDKWCKVMGGPAPAPRRSPLAPANAPRAPSPMRTRPSETSNKPYSGFRASAASSSPSPHLPDIQPRRNPPASSSSDVYSSMDSGRSAPGPSGGGRSFNKPIRAAGNLNAQGGASDRSSRVGSSASGGASSMDAFMKEFNRDTLLQDLPGEYLRQRAAVLAELQRAKDEAEVEKRKIMTRINHVIETSRWNNK